MAGASTLRKSMKTFLLTALLKRVLLDTNSIKVRASSKEHAIEIAREFLSLPIGESPYSKDVPFVVLENRDTVSIEVQEID